MSNIRAGDVVVCIDDRPCRCGRCGGVPSPVVRNAFYRVELVIPERRGAWLCLAGVPAPVGHRPGIYEARFRKIEAPRSELSERIKKSRPIKIGADA